MEDEFGKRSSFTGGFYRVTVKVLNIIAWATLCIIAIGIVISYVTDHKLTIIHDENPPAVSAAAPADVSAVVPADTPVAAPNAGNKIGG